MSRQSDSLKETIFNKNNTTGIYLQVIKENGLKITSEESKALLVAQIVKEMQNCYGRVKKDSVTTGNFNKIVTKINSTVKTKMKKFLSDPRNISIMQEQRRRMQISERPTMSGRHGRNYNEETAFPTHYRPEQYEPDFDSGGLHTRDKDFDSEESITDRVQRMEQERAQEYNMRSQRPPTPDFSLEPKSRKQKEAERREKEERKKQMEMQQQMQHKQPSINDFYGTTITDGVKGGGEDGDYDSFFNPINENFVNSQNVDYEAAIDPYTNNVNTYTTGVDPNAKDFDDVTSYEDQIRAYENETALLHSKEGRKQQPVQQPVHQPIAQHPSRPMSGSTHMHPNYQHQMHQQQLNQQQLRQQQLYQRQMQQQQMQQNMRTMHQTSQTLNPQIQQHIDNIMQQQAIKYQEEINKLRQQLANNVSPDQNSQIQLLNHELTQQKLLNIQLQEKLKLNKPIFNEETDEKLKIIEEKKSQIIAQMNNLKEKYEKTATIIDEQNKNKEILDDKLKNIRSTIENNLALYNSYEKNEIIDTEQCVKNNNIYTYTFANPIDMLTAIEIHDYSFPDMLHNITPFNNVLYISSDVNNEVMCDAQTTYKRDNNIHSITLAPGNYTIDYLIECLNKVLSQIDVTMQLKPANNYIKFYSSKSTFSLITDFSHYKNNMLSILGFVNGSLHNNEMSYVSSKSYDLRADKVVTMRIPNLSTENKAFCKFNVSSSKVTKHAIQLSKPLNNITHFDLEFRDSKNNLIYFADKSVVIDFSLKTVQTGLPIVNVDEHPNVCGEKDYYDQITEMMK